MKYLRVHPKLAIVVVALALALAALSLSPSIQSSDMGKTDMRSRPAPEFSLLDQTGKSVRLADLRGRAVALGFIYTNCEEMCPLAMSKFEEVYDRLDVSQRG